MMEMLMQQNVLEDEMWLIWSCPQVTHIDHHYFYLEENMPPCSNPSQQKNKEKIQWKLDFVYKIEQQNQLLFYK